MNGLVEKMKLVRVQGTLPQLNDFLDACCMDGRFDLEPATRYMSDSLAGYAALNEKFIHPPRDQIETMAKGGWRNCIKSSATPTRRTKGSQSLFERPAGADR
ncbi:MAG: hypothetical protein ACLTY5_06270 [Angelakisella sp.]